MLIGNSGAHVMAGGAGDDIFAFRTPSDGPNTITDFNNTTAHDVVAIEAAGFGGSLTPGMDVTPVFESSSDNQFQFFAAVFHYDTSNRTLYYSPDSTTASEVALATFQPGVMLTPHDLICRVRSGAAARRNPSANAWKLCGLDLPVALIRRPSISSWTTGLLPTAPTFTGHVSRPKLSSAVAGGRLI